MSTYWPEAKVLVLLLDGSIQHFSDLEEIRRFQHGGFEDPNTQTQEFSDPGMEIRRT
jgi:hypothetical protein